MDISTPEAVSPRGAAQLGRPKKFTQSSASPARKSGRWLAGVLLAVVAIGLGFCFWTLSRQLAPQIITSSATEEETNPALAPQKSIAVLPFEGVGEDKQKAFLADGAQDDILSALAKVADLKVISGTSVSSYAPRTPRNLSEIADALGVAYVVEGSVQQIGTTVHITAQLNEARTNARLWSQSYERDLSEVFAIQTEIVQQIISRLNVTVSPKEQAAIAER